MMTHVKMIIKSSWKNRATIYWVPFIMVFLALPDFNFWGSFQPLEGLKMLFLAALLIGFLEYKIFGYQVTLCNDSFSYRATGFPTFSKKVFSANTITDYRVVFFDKSEKFKSAFIELNVAGSKEFINIASFAGSDVRKIEEWLRNKTA
jgi:hypothetical protein